MFKMKQATIIYRNKNYTLYYSTLSSL